jgi:trans-aconitate methyltransferase
LNAPRHRHTLLSIMAHQWDAADYAAHSAQQQRWARELIAKLALRGDERLLDIGSGDGKVTAELAAALPRGSIVGIDNAPDMVRHATAQFGHVPNLSFIQMDASSIAFAEPFDVIFSNAALHWIYDHRPVLRGIARALRPGGRLLVQMGGKGNGDAVRATLDRVAATDRWAPFFRNFDFRYGFHAPEDYRGWLTDAGLTPRRVELIPKDMTHAGRTGLNGWLRTTWLPWTAPLPAEQRDQFIDDVADAYLALHPLDAAGNAHVAMVRLEVEADRSPACAQPAG